MSDYPGTNLLDYTFPLRPDLNVRLVLPDDLRLNEARRLTAFLESLVDVTKTSYPNP